MGLLNFALRTMRIGGVVLLSRDGKKAVRHEMSSDISSKREPFHLSVAQFEAAIDATDRWVDANISAFNDALPAVARNDMSPAQKTELVDRILHARIAEGK